MPTTECVTVTLPSELVHNIDRLDRNRSHFIGEALRREINRRCHEELLKSLEAPHSDSLELTKLGMAEWADNISDREEGELVDAAAGKPVRWVEGTGWIEDSR